MMCWQPGAVGRCDEQDIVVYSWFCDELLDGPLGSPLTLKIGQWMTLRRLEQEGRRKTTGTRIRKEAETPKLVVETDRCHVIAAEQGGICPEASYLHVVWFIIHLYSTLKCKYFSLQIFIFPLYSCFSENLNIMKKISRFGNFLVISF